MSELNNKHNNTLSDLFITVSETVNIELNRRANAINPINNRIKSMRDKSINKNVAISSERARLLTEFYTLSKNEEKHCSVQRALSFKYLMQHMTLPVEENQLLVGLRGPNIKMVPTYPEICCHSVEDLELLNTRDKNPYEIDEKTLSDYKDIIIPFWSGKSIRDIIFSQMSSKWKAAYDAGVFTEFMEQRAPGHTAGGHRLFSKGLFDIKKEIKEKKETLNSNDVDFKRKTEELKAMDIAADALIIYANRYAEKLTDLAKQETDIQRKKELEKMAEISQKVPMHAPQTFWEALQHYWYIHVGIVTELNPWDAFSPGRLDQHLLSFYREDIKNGRLTREKAKELLEAFWLKFNNQPAPPKVGVTSYESNTYNDFSKINIGGLKTDGSDGVNELSYLVLEVLEDMRTVQPNTAVLISEKNPDDFLERCMELVKSGFGEPPIFNFDGIFLQLLRQGKLLADAIDGGCSGCVETGAFGKESYILTGYFNLPKILEITLNNGIDPSSGEKIGISSGDPTTFEKFENLAEAFVSQLAYFIDIKMSGNDVIENVYARKMQAPFLSLWIDDCVKTATDYNEGGARYNTQYIQIVGLGTTADSLLSIKYNIYDNTFLTMSKLLAALKENYNGYEEMRLTFLNKTPKFGNDDDYADNMAQFVFDTCIDIIEGYPLSPLRKASKKAYFLPTTAHVYFGHVCGALPGGRPAKRPISEGISPTQGADRHGIAAVFRSIGKLNHIKTGGTLLNQRIVPGLLDTFEVQKKFSQLIRSYFRMGGHHVQFNVVSTDLLYEAQNKPEEYQDLMVRVAGYSDYFTNLSKGLQNEIIARTEQNA